MVYYRRLRPLTNPWFGITAYLQYAKLSYLALKKQNIFNSFRFVVIFHDVKIMTKKKMNIGGDHV